MLLACFFFSFFICLIMTAYTQTFEIQGIVTRKMHEITMVQNILRTTYPTNCVPYFLEAFLSIIIEFKTKVLKIMCILILSWFILGCFINQKREPGVNILPSVTIKCVNHTCSYILSKPMKAESGKYTSKIYFWHAF